MSHECTRLIDVTCCDHKTQTYVCIDCGDVFEKYFTEPFHEFRLVNDKLEPFDWFESYKLRRIK